MTGSEIYVFELEADQYRGDNQTGKWVPLDKLAAKKSMTEMANYLSDLTSPLVDAVSEFEVCEIEVGVQISGEGKVGFMGSGVKSGGNASLKVKFFKKQNDL